MVSTAGQTHSRLMAKGGTTTLIIIFPALHSICPLWSLGCTLQNRLPMFVITCFQFALLSIVLQPHRTISQTRTHGIAEHLFFCWLQPDENCYLRRGAKDVALEHSVLNSPAWKDSRPCFLFFKATPDTLYVLLWCSVVILTLLSITTKQGRQGKDTCHSIRLFTLGEVLLCYRADR